MKANCLLPLVAEFVALASPVTTTAASEKPNILFIMADDHTSQAIGAYGSRLAALNPTPTIDRLAKEGVLMKNAFCVNSICTPSRANIMTGMHSHRNGVTTLNGRVRPEDQTLAIEMKKAGYETAMVGKWHLQEEPASFDFYTVLPGQGSYFNPIFRTRGPNPWPNNTYRVAGYDSVHSSDAIAGISLKWLKNRKDKSEPFFLMCHFKAPHDNFENAERYDWLYEDIDIPEPESLWERRNHGPVGKPQYGTSVGKRNTRRNIGDHMFVDKSLSDYIAKRWMYEETQRMPFLVRYPKRFKPGTVVEDIVNNVDYAPTMLELAGVSQDAMPKQFQGRSFVANMEGRAPADSPTQTYYRYWMHMAHHDNPAHYGLRTKDYELIFFYGLPLDAPGAVEKPTEAWLGLYDLRNDPNEMNNVVNDLAYAKVLAEIKRALLKEKERIGDTDEKYSKLMNVREVVWNN